jgi:adhesin HecA-like repeat protein
MSMALTLAATSGPARFSAAALTNPQGFVVSDGIVRLTANGLSTRNLAVLEIEKTRTVVIDAAPQSGAPQAFATAAQP